MRIDAVAYFTTKLDNGKVLIEDSKGEHLVSKDALRLFYFMLEPYTNGCKVAWDIMNLLKPILDLMPRDTVAMLKSGERVEIGTFRIIMLPIRHGYMLGISHKERQQIKGNFYTERVMEAEIYELQQYYSDENMPDNVAGVEVKADYLITQLERMGLSPRKLTSAASIYKECVLDKMPIPTIWTMPEESLPMMELCANYVREWHGDFKSGDWDRKQLCKYDLTSAYPSATATLPNLDYAEYVPFEAKPLNPYWGILKGKLILNTVVNPLVDAKGNSREGTFENEVITTDDLEQLNKWKLGTFEPQSGWYIVLKKNVKLFSYTMKRLFEFRGGNPVRDALAKAMAVSTWGKFLEMHGEDYGDYFNGIYACMVTSQVRNRVNEFIYSNGIQDDVVEVTVDGFRCPKLLKVQKIRKFGEWRLIDDGQSGKIEGTAERRGAEHTPAGSGHRAKHK